MAEDDVAAVADGMRRAAEREVEAEGPACCWLAMRFAIAVAYELADDVAPDVDRPVAV